MPKGLGLVETARAGICRYEKIGDGNRRQMSREGKRVRCRPAGKRGFVVDYRNYANPHIDERPPGKRGPIRGPKRKKVTRRKKAAAPKRRAPARRTTKRATPRVRTRQVPTKDRKVGEKWSYTSKKGVKIKAVKKANGVVCRTFKMKMFAGGGKKVCRTVCARGIIPISNKPARNCA